MPSFELFQHSNVVSRLFVCLFFSCVFPPTFQSLGALMQDSTVSTEICLYSLAEINVWPWSILFIYTCIPSYLSLTCCLLHSFYLSLRICFFLQLFALISFEFPPSYLFFGINNNWCYSGNLIKLFIMFPFVQQQPEA